MRLKWPRFAGWTFAVSAWLTISVGNAWGQVASRPELPAMAPYKNLPAEFGRALQELRGKIGVPADDPEAVRKMARLYQANRLFPEARACYRVIATTAGGLTARDHYYLANIAVDEGDLEAAQKEFSAVVDLDPHYLPARLALAEAFFKSGREDDAAKAYEGVLKIEANQPQASLGLARIELQKGDEEAAVTRLDELMAGHPDAVAAAALFAKILERRGDTDRAIAMTQIGAQKPGPNPDDPWLSALLADCYDVQRLSITFEEYFKLGKMDEATPLLDRLAILDPKGPITMMFAGFSHAQSLQHVTAIREYYASLANGGDPEKVSPHLVRSLLALGKLDEAAGLMADLYSKMPDSVPIAKAYSEVALQQGDEKMARVLLTKILEKEPYLQPQNMSLAKILWTAGDRDAAAVYLQRVASVLADDVPSRALLGEYYLGKSDPLAAIKPLQQALAVAAMQPPVRTRLTALLATAYLQAGNATAEQGKFADAADYAEKSIGLVPDDLDGYACKANACVQLKQFHRAADALAKLTALQPDNPTIYLSLGDVLYQDGNATEARRQWQKARQLVGAGDNELRGAIELRLNGEITADTFK